LYVRHGALDHAERDFREMLAIFTRLRAGHGIGGAHGALGDIAELRGKPAVAVREYDTAMAEYERLGLRVRQGEVLLRRAAVLRAQGREQEALADVARGQELIGDAPVHRGPGLERRSSGGT
jgi:tetratricopeptide (TPR) repeat protein